MDGGQPRPGSRVTRRDVLRLGVGTVGAAMLGAAGCAPNADKAKGGGGGGGALVLLSTQLRPVEEAEKMRQKILADYGGKVDFLGEDAGPFHDRIEAEARAGKGSVGVIGGEHGDMAALAAQDRLMDLSDLTQQLADRGFNEDYLELAKLGGDKPLYIPWMQATWAYANPQSTSYAFMQEPLQGGEVWLAWDHVARMIEALRGNPEGFVAFACPVGPKGLGYLAVLNGLAIPKTAPNPEDSKKLITYLTDPKTAAITAREVGFFPPTKAQQLPADVDEGIKAEAAALASRAGNPKALTSLLPVGLGDKSGAYNDVFRSALEGIVLKSKPVGQVLDAEGKTLQGVLDQTKARCWKPDPESSGTCKVG